VRAVAIALLLAALSVPLPSAWAQGGAAPPTGQPQPAPGGGPFSPLPPAQPPSQPAPQAPKAPTSSTNDDNGPTTLGTAGLFAAGMLVIVVIGWIIVRDARRSLPERARKRRRRKKVEPAAPAVSPSGRRPPPPRPRKGPQSHAKRKKSRPKRRAR
jgi:hypothetical protein